MKQFVIYPAGIPGRAKWSEIALMSLVMQDIRRLPKALSLTWSKPKRLISDTSEEFLVHCELLSFINL